MGFFNKKEDIIEIELTPYGRKLLSQGKMKPKYYAFYDDDILYDTGKANFTETNSQSKTRILTETPSLKVQSTNFGVETNLNTNYEELLDKYMPYPMGTNSFVEKKNSGWGIYAMNKEVDSYNLTTSAGVVKVSEGLVSQGQPTLQIPQINCKIEFTMSVDNYDTYRGDYTDLANDLEIERDGEGNFLKLEKETLLFYLLEKNGFVNSDAFEVEVFLYEEDEKDLKKLQFLKQGSMVENDLLIEQQYSDQMPTQDNVEYYMDLLLDSEIPDREICDGINKLKESNIYLELDLKCPDKGLTSIDIYSSTLGDVEECD